MKRHEGTSAAIALSAATAGPAGLAIMLIWASATQSSPTPFAWWATVLGFLVSFLLMLIYALPIGFFVGILPSVAGVWLLVWTGDRIAVMRHPIVWALIGVVLGVAVDALIGLAAIGHMESVAWASGVGAISMLVGRCAMRWHD